MPRRPNWVALGILSLFIVILSLPMLSGKWLASLHGDQYSSAYAFYSWEATEWRATGSIPLWNPMIMGGLPFLAVVTHGDILYPTALLRYFLPVHVVMNLAFFLHYILAGFLTYLFLRRMAAAWTGAVTGGIAYQLSGIMISYVQPGHDGKLFVSTLLPLAFLALVVALRDRRFWGYPLLAVAVALCLLSPHVQATYYLLIAAALFALYLTFGEVTTEPSRPRLARLALAFAAIVAGFGMGMPQILPFLQYIPHSPRAAGYSVGYSGSTSFGVPWDHVPEFFIASFVGHMESYWGSNPLKLHSEYLGLPVIALAILGFGDRRRRLVWWMGGIGLLFLLIALGGATPFYHLWWTVMPMVKKTRAPGMVFFVVAFCVAMFAAFGVTRFERGEGGWRHIRVWLIAAGVVALFGAIGVFGQLAVSLALAGHGIAQVIGYQGNELRYYDDLLGGRNEWRYLLSSTRLWQLLAVRYVLIPDSAALPGYHIVMGPVVTAAGTRAFVYEADTIPPYARVVPAALKVDNDSAIPPTLADPRLPGFDQVVLLPKDAPLSPPPLRGLPPPSASRARVTAWDAGQMTVELDPAPRDSSYVMIAENWYLDWRASVDGQAARVLRGDHALLTIPVAPGARKIELRYHSSAYAQGKVIAFATLVIVLAGFVVPPLVARRRRSA